MMQLTKNAHRQHDTREDAERAVEIYYPPGYLYEVVEHQTVAGSQVFETFVVKAFTDNGRFIGFCFDPTEATDTGIC